MQIPDDQLRGFIDNRLPSRRGIDDLRALGHLHDDPKLFALADQLDQIRQAVRGGQLDNWGGNRRSSDQ